MDAMFAFPPLLLAIVIAFLLGGSVNSGVLVAAIAITITYIPQYFRVVRNHVISVREEPYVEAARALGAKPFTILRRYVFFNVVQNVPVIATLNAADAMLTLTALGFLGYGVQPTQGAEWGYDVSRAVSDAASGIWWTGLFPGLAIVLLVTGLTLLGEGLNETINPVLADGARSGQVELRGAEHGRRRGAARGVTGRPRGPRPARLVRNAARLRARGRRRLARHRRRVEVLGLVGESGCGKSTLGRGILGLLPEGARADGEVLYEGRNLVDDVRRASCAGCAAPTSG